MKKAISLFLVLVMCLSLCACGGGDNTEISPIVGTWNGYTSGTVWTYVFYPDGTYTFSTEGALEMGVKAKYTFDEETSVLTFTEQDGDTFSRTIELNECYMVLNNTKYGRAYSSKEECDVLNELLGKWKHTYLSGCVLEFSKDGTYILTTTDGSTTGIYIYNPATKVIELPRAGITLKFDEKADKPQIYSSDLSLIFQK